MNSKVYGGYQNSPLATGLIHRISGGLRRGEGADGTVARDPCLKGPYTKL